MHARFHVNNAEAIFLNLQENWSSYIIVLILSVSKMLVSQSSPTLCSTLDCSPPGSSAHRILQVRVLEWVAMPFSRGSSQPRDWTHVSCIAGRFFTSISKEVWKPLCHLPKLMKTFNPLAMGETWKAPFSSPLSVAQCPKNIMDSCIRAEAKETVCSGKLGISASRRINFFYWKLANGHAVFNYKF